MINQTSSSLNHWTARGREEQSHHTMKKKACVIEESCGLADYGGGAAIAEELVAHNFLVSQNFPHLLGTCSK